MSRFTIKAILFYLLSTICALTICGIINVAIFWLFAVAGLLELGSSPLFIAGLAITETSLSVFCVSSISEDVLYSIGEYEDDALTETTEEKAT